MWSVKVTKTVGHGHRNGWHKNVRWYCNHRPGLDVRCLHADATVCFDFRIVFVQFQTCRTMTTELIPSIPNELLRIVRTCFISRGWLASRPGMAHSGSMRSRLIVAWQTPSSKAGRLPANSRGPAAPIAWPMKLLVLFNRVRLPGANTWRRACTPGRRRWRCRWRAC